MADSLTRQPVGRVIANRKSLGRQALQSVPEGDNSPKLGTSGVSHYSLSPGASTRSHAYEPENAYPQDGSEPDELVMTDKATDLRSRMEAELIALRRAQSVFADTHPSVDVHGKLQDLQEMYIGDLLVKDCQITQMRSQIEALLSDRSARSSNVSTPVTSASVPPAHTSMLAARVQSLQRSVAQERQRRMEVEARLDHYLHTQEPAADTKSQLSKLSTAHRIEVHQLKARIGQLQEANKRLQEKFFADNDRKRSHGLSSGEQSPAATATGAVSPASSAVGTMDKVPYVKYASLRAEKRQVEAKLNALVESLKSEKNAAILERDTELEKLKEHHRRVVADLERKARLAENSKTEDGKELRDLKRLFEETAREKDRLENCNLELRIKADQVSQDLRDREAEVNELIESEKFLSLELEERERVIAESALKGEQAGPLRQEMDRLKEERLDLLEKIEEREDMLKSLQDESVSNRSRIVDLQSKLEAKEREISAMVAQADELDNLLARADQDVTSSRVKIQALSAELDSARTKRGNGDESGELRDRLNEAESHREKLQSELSKLDAIVKAMTVNADQVKRGLETEIQQLTHRLAAVTDDKARLTFKLESVIAGQAEKAGKGGKDPALADAEAKIGQLEDELETIRRAMEDNNNSYDSAARASSTATDGLTENVARAESMFHRAVELCSNADFSPAVALLEQAASALSQLPKHELAANDPDTLRILESDIYGQLGVAFQSLSQVAEAIDSYTTAVDVDPQAHACHANLAVLLQHQSRTKEAEAHAAIAVKLAGDIDEYQQLLSQIRGASNVSLSSPTSPGRALRHSTRW